MLASSHAKYLHFISKHYSPFSLSLQMKHKTWREELFHVRHMFVVKYTTRVMSEMDAIVD